MGVCFEDWIFVRITYCRQHNDFCQNHFEGDKLSITSFEPHMPRPRYLVQTQASQNIEYLQKKDNDCRKM